MINVSTAFISADSC